MSAPDASDTTAAAAVAAPPSAATSDGIILRLPSKYQTSSTSSTSSVPSASSVSLAFAAPPDGWLDRTWAVTHSTLSMWRSAQNVRIRYQSLPDDAQGRHRNEDRVEYESNKPLTQPTKTPRAVRSVEGVNRVGADGTSFDWRGKGWLCFVTSHWEILGWGERPTADGTVERWVVTWFAPTLFTREGIDYYSDRRAGQSPATATALAAAIDATTPDWPPALRALVAELRPVGINLPWSE